MNCKLEWVNYLLIKWWRAHDLGSGGKSIWGWHAHLRKLVGDFREVGAPRRPLLEGHNHKVLKELPLLPLEQLQLQCPVAGCSLQHRLDVDQALGVGWGQVSH